MKIEIDGVFVARKTGENSYMMDAYQAGNVDIYEERQESKTYVFDGVEVVKTGDFYKIKGTYEVEDFGDIYATVKVKGKTYSFPLHRIKEVKK